MPTESDSPSHKQPESSAPLQPYVKPAVERIPLNEAKIGDGPSSLVDLATDSS